MSHAFSPLRTVLATAAFAALLLLGRVGAEDHATVTVDKQDLSMSATIDDEIARMWKEKNLVAAPAADDAEFLRRVTLDLTGRIPAPDDLVAFLKDKSTEKRKNRIDALLASDEYADHFSVVWMQILIGNDMLAKLARGGAINAWLTDAFKKNVPYDKFVRDLLTAEGVSDEDGASDFMLRFDQATPAIDAAATTSKLFLGVQIQCAQCHNHPYEHWKKEQFHEMAAFFARLKRTPLTNDAGKRFAFVIREDLRGNYKMPDTNPPQVMEPTFLTGEKADARPGVNLRQEFARWVTDKENPWFAKMIVNRYWAMFMGRGLVDPIDDFGDSNPASHPELLNKLANDFVAKGYDLKYLCRILANAKTYQLASKPPSDTQDDKKYFTHFRMRPLSPEQLLNALVLATGIGSHAAGLDADKLEKLRLMILQRFIFVFGNDEGAEEVSFEGTIPQALMMLNGKLSNDAVRAASNLNLARVLEENAQPQMRVEALYLTCLGRYPTTEEAKTFTGFAQKFADVKAPEGNNQPLQGIGALDRGTPGGGKNGKGGGGKGPGNQRPARPGAPVPGATPYEDIMWALLNSSEFRFNH